PRTAASGLLAKAAQPGRWIGSGHSAPGAEPGVALTRPPARQERMAMRTVSTLVAAGLLLLALSAGRGQELPHPKKLPDIDKNDAKKPSDDEKADAAKNGGEGSSAYTRRKPPHEREAHPVDPFMPPAPALVDPRTGYWQQVAPWPVIGGIAGWPVVE